MLYGISAALKKVRLFLLICIALGGNAYAQLPSIQWQRSVGGTQNEYDGDRETHVKTIRTADNGYVLLGTSYSSDGDVSTNYGSHDLWISKFNDKGVLQWEKSFGGNGWDWGSDVKQTSDGGYVVCGTTNSQDGVFAGRPGAFDYWLLKLSSYGELEWQKFYGGTDNDYGTSLLVADDGGYVMCGRATSNNKDVSGNHGGLDIWLLKVDNTGSLLWQRCFGGGYSEFGGVIEKTQDGNYIIGAYQAQTGSNIITTANFDAYVLKVDTGGNELWHKKYGGSYYEDIRRIIPTSDGGYIFAGTTRSNDGDVSGNHPAAFGQTPYDFDQWIVKLDATGNILWQKPLGGKFWDHAFDVAELSDSYIICGYANSNDGDVSGNHGMLDGWITRLSNSGALLEQKCYGGSDADAFYSLLVLDEHEYIVAGTSGEANGDVATNHGMSDMWLMKFSNKPFQFNTIKGIVYKDENGNGMRDVGEELFDNKYMLIKSNVGDTQRYKNTGIGTFETRVDTGRFTSLVAGNDAGYRAAPRHHVSVFPGYNNTDEFSFGMVPSGLVSDVLVFVDTIKSIRAGLTAQYAVHYTYRGTRTTLDGRIKIVKDPRLTYQSSSVPLAGVRGDTLIFSVSNLQPQIIGNFTLELSVPNVPVVNIGDSLAIHYNIMPVTPDSAYFDVWDIIKHRVRKPINNIQGYAYVDLNGNNMPEDDEPFFYDGIVTVEKNGSVFASSLAFGTFDIETDTGRYITKFQTNQPYYQISPSAQASDFATYSNVDSVIFALKPLAGIRDLQVHIAPLSNAKPGFSTDYIVTYFNKGTDTVPAGSIKLTKSARTTLENADVMPDVVNQDTLTWNYAALYPLEGRSIYIQLKVDPPPAVNMGDTLKFVASISPVGGDTQPDDNVFELKQLVVNSFDPNDKMEVHAGTMTPAKVLDGEYLTYMIRFQNTGNATATHVIVRDTLDAKLDWSTLEMIMASHNYRLTIDQQHQLSWAFNNINLPDSFVDEPGSHGYILYRIKPHVTLVPGDTIYNAAGIYFDYNLPIQTNNAKTAIVSLSTLPVTLTSFKAVLSGAVVNLSWKTAAEFNSEFFEVQRSSNGVDFFTIGKVPAKNIATGASYAFTDETPATGYNYYRLKMVDLNHSGKLSPIAIVLVKGADIVSTVYPNPTDGEVTVDVKGNVTGNVSVAVVDQAGRVVLAKVFGRPSGNRLIEPLSLGKVSKGIYTLRITIGGSATLHKLIVK
jgi:uncharacterized repeat protein (TIGR01451 family)